METKTRNRLILAAALILAGGVVAYNMFFSLTPPRHADHDHAIAKLDAGGFLWIEGADGVRRNLVGRPDKVLVTHWFNPEAADLSEQQEAAAFATANANDSDVEFLFIAQAASWDGVRENTRSVGIPETALYLDIDSKTGELCGIRRQPETVIFDPAGFLAYQSKGPAPWTGGTIRAQIERAKAGVDEIH